ncbi:putative tail structural protein [Roseobacter phage CRP-7]|nr:putative tail structural protein [Roseobacter phage CRP-7]
MGFRDQNNKVAPIDDGGNFDTDTSVNSVTSTSEAAANALLAASHAEDALAAKIAAELAETNAETAETNAETAETNASTSATNAATSETNASTSETNAAASASAAASSAADAQSSEDDAEVSETNAANSAAAALVSENNASTSETNAAASAVTATTQAGISTTKAGEASVSAAAALVSENNASTSETNAATSETNAATSESNAAASAVSAETAKTNAETAETNAATSETNAAASAVTATTQAGIATTKAGEALTSANNAEAAKVAAAASQVASSNSQVAAASSAASAAAVFDQFDDTYLGSKASEPTVDNDGNALVVGALFYNSSTQGMFIWTGTEWVAASAAGGASLNNFSYTATAGQTTFTGSDENTNNLSYTVDNIIVTLNGVVLEGGGTDYTATDGSSIVLTSGAALSDEVNIVAFKTFTTADMVSSANGGAFQGNVDFNSGIDVTGNITVTGTVDGVDVAAFKASYDALDLDGDYVNSTGDTMTGNLSFGDNDKAIFGAGSDLQIYHDPANGSIVKDNGVGRLLLDSENGTGISLTSGGIAKTMISATKDSDVKLYNNGAPKLATTSTGVDITGTLTSDGLLVEGEVAGQGASIEAHATVTEFGDALLIARSDNASNNLHAGVKIQGSNNPFYIYQTNGANTNKLRFNYNAMSDAGGQMTIDNNGDLSLYDSTGTTPKFFWDASAERLGIGTSSPATSFDVRGVASTYGLNVAGGGAATGYIGEITNNSGAAGSRDGLKVETLLSDSTTKILTAASNSVDRFVVTGSGNVGIGTSSPSAKIDASGTYRMQLRTDDAVPELRSITTNGAAFKELGFNGLDLRFFTSSSERMRIDSSGNVGIGTSSPSQKLTVGFADNGTDGISFRSSTYANLAKILVQNETSTQNGNLQFHTRSGGSVNEAMRIDSNGRVAIGGTTVTDVNMLNIQGSGASSNIGVVLNDTNTSKVYGIQNGGSALKFFDYTASTERMRIDSSGNLGIGRTPSYRLDVDSTGMSASGRFNRYTDGSLRTLLIFRSSSNGSDVGAVYINNNSTSYNTSSDYRLKTDAQPMTGASARVQALNPVNFEWIADGTRVDGFLAHEAQEVVPEAVSGTKDAMMDEEYEVTPAVLDDDGNVVTEAVMGTRSVPDYQGIDQSKLVPLLTAALQEALTKIDALETRITALEG